MGEGRGHCCVMGSDCEAAPFPSFSSCPPPTPPFPWLAGGGGIWGLRYLSQATVVPLLLAEG